MNLSQETEKKSYAEFLAFQEIVQRQAAKLGLKPGTKEFNDFGLAMVEAVEHGRFESRGDLVQ